MARTMPNARKLLRRVGDAVFKEPGRKLADAAILYPNESTGTHKWSETVQGKREKYFRTHQRYAPAIEQKYRRENPHKGKGY